MPVAAASKVSKQRNTGWSDRVRQRPLRWARPSGHARSMLTSPDRVSRSVRRGFRKRQRIHARYLAHHYLPILTAPSLNGKAHEIHRSLQAKSLGDFP